MATRRSARQAARRRSRRAHANQQKPLYRRTLRYEPLEDRRLLALVTVNTPLDIVDLDDGLTSLREAIFATNLVSGPDEITFDFGHDGPETILLTQGELRISDDLTITGPGAEFLTIDASGNDPTPDRKEGFGSRILNINDGNSAHLLDVVINGLVLTGGDIRGDGGAIVSNEHLTILYCTFSQNWTSGDGGAIYSERGNLTISGSTITANSGADHGGGVSHIGDFSIARTVTVIDSTINGNSTTRFDGGGINVENASVVIQGSIVSGNSARREGGGIYLRNRANFPSRLEITESTISGNTTESRGGGGISSSGINGNNLRLIVSASVISGNSVGGWDGGGILSRYCDLTVSNSTITDNSAKLDGGGISARWGHVNVTSSTISGNSAQHDGGGVYGHYITVDDTTISGNSTVNGRGGGIFVGVDLTLSHSTVSDNSSGGDGGGIEGTPAFLKLVESIISGNTSKRNGGGINSSLITAIENSTISGNSASRSGGGIYSRGPLTLMHCIVEGNSAIHDGGGIAIFGTGGGTSITDTSIIGNSAALGGGIHSQDKGLTLTAVTMSGNSARGNGGGILILGPELLLINSTVSGNTAEGAGGGLYLLNRGSDVFSIDHSTIVANSATGFGGGIAVVGGGLQLNHSIVARNEATFGQDLTPLFGSAEVRFSLIGRNSQSELAEAPVGSPDANGNLVGGPVHGAIDPLLSPLAANGGPTMTHALLPGSPAINAGDLNAKAGEGGVPLYDQRGEPFGRVVNGRIDIGAFEYQEASDLNLLVDTLDDESDGDHGRGDLSLREAIELANLYPSDDTIRFDPGLTAAGPATILLTMGELRINDDVSVEGPGAEFLTIDASGNDPTPTINDGRGSRVFSIFRGETFIGGLTLTGGDVGDISGSGGAISSNPNVTIADCFIIDNSARGDGGAVYSRGRSLTVIRSIISGNSANGDGGGIRKESGTLVVEESTLSNNTTRVAGGGISAAYGAQFHVRKSHLRDNSAYSFGGALQITYGIGESTIEGSVITDNSAGDGGGIWNLRAKLAVMSSVISDNSTEGWGGGIHSYSDSDLTLISSLLSGNMASSGGAIATSNDGTRLKSLTLVDTTIINNYASFYGGGIFADRSNLTAIGTTISDNAANRIGGGIAFRDPGLPVTALSLTQCTISGNQSKQHGGGVYIYHHPDSQHTISHSTIAFNVSDADDSGSGSGGGLFIRRGSIDIDHSIIAGNLDRTEVGPDLTGSVGTTLVVTNSLIGTNTGSGLAEASAGSPDANGNIIGGPVHGVIDPQLSSLADNGGPTLTHALLPGSPATNAGDLNAKAGEGGVPLYDQRGEPFGRVVNGRIDIGAFEYQEASDLNLVVDTLSDESDGNFGRGDLSLREAIELANLYPSDDTIRFDPALTAAGPATILLTMGELWITDDVSIQGPGADLLTIDASGNDHTPTVNDGMGTHILRVADNNIQSMFGVLLSGLAFTGGDVPEAGGAIFSVEKLTVIECSIHNNSTGTAGGGIYAFRGELLVYRSNIHHNTVSGAGFSDGGGIFLNRATSELVASVISGNLANRFGGGVSIRYGRAEITDSTISGNRSNQDGGAGLFISTAVTVRNSTISGNKTTGMGGGLFAYRSALTVESSTISGNESGSGGGGISHASGDLTITRTTITQNIAAAGGNGGGGILTFPRAVAFLDHTIVVGNQDLSGRAPDIAGIFNSRYSLIGLGADFLGPLADNGGPTMTHALVPGSPAINAGDPAAKAGVGGVPLYDQRGAPFTRVYGGRIDIGALEAQPNPLTGDYNFSGVVDAADAVVWRKTLGSTTDLRADGNGDGVVDQADWQVWRENFGRTAESVEQGARSTEPEESPPNRPAWQPPASPGVSLATSRPTFRPAAQGFAPQDNLLAALASPRSTSHLRNDFAPERWNPTRNIDFGLAEANVDAFDRVFETVGWATPTIKRRL